MDSPLRLIANNPLDQLARTIEALLVVASAPLSVEELAEAADDHTERVEAALGLVRERYTEGRSGIVLEHVAGGWAFRSAREAAEACARLFEKPAQRNLSQASLETLAIIAYLGPCSRPDIGRIRGVAADSAVANLVERGSTRSRRSAPLSDRLRRHLASRVGEDLVHDLPGAVDPRQGEDVDERHGAPAAALLERRGG